MKWIRTAITVVIMVVSVSVIVLGINNLTKPIFSEDGVTFNFEITDISNDNDIKYTPTSLYNDLKDFFDVKTSIYYNFIEENEVEYAKDDGFFYINIYDNATFSLTLHEDGTMKVESDMAELGLITLTSSGNEYIKPPILTGTIAIILGLVPLIVASGVLYFMLRKNNLGD